VWADGTPTSDIISNSVTICSTGKIGFYSNFALTAGVIINNGQTAWSAICDRNAKTNLVEVDYELLTKCVADELPIFYYNFIGNDESLVCIGPMAQDWHSVFSFIADGKRDTEINTLDLDGISLAAIIQLDKEISALENDYN
jgi:hypothetical protein